MSMVLVTGGTGFIGSNIVEDLLNEGYDVRILDNFHSGYERNVSEFHNKIEIVKGDIRNYELVKKSLKDVDYVSHQAALISVTDSVKNPVPISEVNVLGTLNLLAASRDSGVRKIVYASSSAVYGNSREIPFKESVRSEPISPYGLTKLSNEQYFQMFHELYGLESVGLRYFNVFGPRQSPDSQYSAVIPKFINKMMNNERPTVYGDGNQTRDFIYVKDVSRININSFDSRITGGEVFNIGYGKGISINYLVNEINNILGKDIKPIYEESRPGDPISSVADISNAIKYLNFKPTFDIIEGLKHTIEWVKGHYG